MLYVIYKLILVEFIFLFKSPFDLLFLNIDFNGFYVITTLKTVSSLNLTYKLPQFLTYILFFFMLFSTFRSTLPRVRLDLLLDLIWKYIIVYCFLVLLVVLLYS